MAGQGELYPQWHGRQPGKYGLIKPAHCGALWGVRWTLEEYEQYVRREHEAYLKRCQVPQVARPPSRAQPQPAVCDEPVAAPHRKTQDTISRVGRIKVSITSYRRRLIDPDNFAGKYFIDALRYAGAIPDDREEDIIVETRQVKVIRKDSECTELTIE